MKFKKIATATIVVVLALVFLSSWHSISRILEADGHQVLRIIWNDISVDWIYIKDAWWLTISTIPGTPIVLILVGLILLALIIYILIAFGKIFFKISSYEIDEKREKIDQKK